MKILVCGSRSWSDGDVIERRISRLPNEAVVIHGGASGVDSIAGASANRHGLTVQVFRPNYDADGRRAPLLRNLRMLDEQPDLVLAFWDGDSRGTAHTLINARNRGIRCEVVRPLGMNQLKPGQQPPEKPEPQK
jgi:hypothetical protein